MSTQPEGGARLSLVLRKETSIEGVWQEIQSMRRYRIHAPAELPGFCTVYMAVVVETSDTPLLSIESMEQVFGHEEGGPLTPYIVELCAGSGSMSQGPRQMGAQVLASVDWNTKAIEHLEKGSSHGKVLQADVTNPEDIYRVHRELGKAKVTIMAGFPCQPYSQQGYQKGEHDVRCGAFYGLLQAMALLQPQAAILECVPQFAENQVTKKALQDFLGIMGWKENPVILDLKDQWVMARKRYWNLLVPCHFPIQGIPAWPSAETPHSIGEVLPVWGKWPAHEEHQLSLNVAEIDAFTNPKFGRDKRVITNRDVAPTVLHSYSVTHEPCPCGCRLFPFSPQALTSKGLRGFWVQSRETCQPRYLHPVELKALLSILPDDNYDPSELRCTNCLLGLAAAPLQSTWVYAHLLKGVAKLDATCSFIDPGQAVAAHKTVLCRTIADTFHLDPDPLAAITIAVGPDSSVSLLAPHSTTVGQFLAAERFTLGWGEGQYLCEGSFNIPPELPLLPSLPLDSCLIRKVKRQRTDPPIGHIVIGLVHRGENLIEIIEAGQFLFQALRQAKLDFVTWVADEAGKVSGADRRCWHSERFFTLDAGTFPRLPLYPAAPGGPAPSAAGLSAGFLAMALSSLLDNAHERHLALPLLLPPLCLDSDQGLQSLHLLRHFLKVAWEYTDGTIYIPAAQANHWTLLVATVHADGLHWQHMDGLGAAPSDQHRGLAKQVSSILDEPFVDLLSARVIQQTSSHTCGTVLIGHVCCCLGLPGHFTHEAIEWMHAKFVEADQGPGPRFLGQSNDDLQRQLATLLAEKGVPKESCESRAHEVIQKLGKQNATAALQASNPWQALKSEASKPGKSIRFLTKEEQQAFIDKRAEEKFGNSTDKPRKKQQKLPSKPQPLTLDASQIQLLPGHFQDTDEDDVAQVALEDIQADGTGIALASKAEAQRFIQAGKHLTTQAMALLVPEELSPEFLGGADGTLVHFAALYRPTGDPLILHGTLIQLGDSPVEHQPPVAPDLGITPPDTGILKMVAYKDEIEVEWTKFLEGPIKAMVALLPKLSLCKEKGCSCPKAHLALDEDASAIIHEVWGRRTQADTFQVYLRVLASAIPEIIRTSSPGLYAEPRDALTKGASSQYGVIWLPGTSKADALHHLRITPDAMALVRLGHRYGLRVAQAHAAKLHKQLKPDEDYIQIQITSTWKLHPLPHGLQKAAIQKLLSEWKWNAKALQPLKGSSTGASWEVGASDDPPAQIMPAFGQEVMITQIRDKPALADPGPKHLLPLRTRKHLLKEQKEQRKEQSQQGDGAAATPADPWQTPGQDPWLRTAKTHSVPAKVPNVVQQRIDEVAQQLKGDVQQHITQASSGTQQAAIIALQSTTDQRFAKLESTVKEMAQHSKKVESWVKDAGIRLSNTEQQMQVMAGAIDKQQLALQQVKQELTGNINQIGASVHTVVQQIQEVKSDMGTQIDQKLDALTIRLEALLEKRPRTEANGC